MKIITNEKLIRRNARIGTYTSLASLLILAGGFYLSISSTQDPNTLPDTNRFTLTWVALLLGFTLSQVGIYFGNRWGRRPRPDELLDKGLENLDDRYAIFHYQTPATHVLVGPAGVWVLIPHHQMGKITYTKNRWRQKGGGCLQTYLRFFAQEGIGRPDLEVASEEDALRKYLHKLLPEEEIPSLHTALVFTNAKAEIDADDAPTPTLLLLGLKAYLLKMAKDTLLPMQKVRQIREALGEVKEKKAT
jgi:hypothetical protein